MNRSFQIRLEAHTRRMDLAVCDGCDGCGLKCAAGTPCTRAEWEALRDHFRTLDPDERRRLLAQDKAVPLGDGVYAAACMFRDTERGRCGVYPARPTICRLFGHTEWLPCPIEKVRSYPDGAVELIRDYAAFERKTFEEWACELPLEPADPAK